MARQPAAGAAAVQAAQESGEWPSAIVTRVSKIGDYYPAEDYHQNYFNDNSGEGYCRYVIKPKLDKFRARFRDKLKS